MDHEFFMKKALALAKKGQGHTSPNPMVGALIVKDGEVKGKGYHQSVGQAHAEVNAIEDAGAQAKGATLYVNLEPCNHTGRTPPCTRKILEAGIKRVVVAMEDPNTIAGGGCVFLKRRGIEVLTGICENEARRLNEAFVKYVHTKSPFVIIKCAATLDGRIATRTGDSRWVTGEKARRYVHRLRHAVDAILVGIGTIHGDNPNLTTRLGSKKGSDPVRIVLDTHLSISPDARILKLDSNSDTILITGNSVSEDKKKKILKKGVRQIVQPVKDGQIDLKPLMVQLGAMGITSLLVEGGGRVIASALKSGIVDKALFFYAPKILGGDDGIPICRGPGPPRMKDCIRVKNIRLQRFGDDVMIEGYIS
ncbi:MAG: bifunctional diaminohydroxyphosphoribosylaminopyrimidine deaminase/5-amino-6-(5-phosphoribosylamino)uracil reductase RibD [Desulfobacterales bacterium]|jgi:diaminohydroxyphosphoribosylaminopyrimidine deaminase/5-amino-6-(5-phosphoribosylamino)uracil reductase